MTGATTTAAGPATRGEARAGRGTPADALTAHNETIPHTKEHAR